MADVAAGCGPSRVEGPPVLGDHVAGATSVDRVDSAERVEIVEGGVAQGADPEAFGDSLTRGSACGVFAVDEAAPGAGVEHDDPNGVGERDRLDGQASAIDQRR